MSLMMFTQKMTTFVQFHFGSIRWNFWNLQMYLPTYSFSRFLLHIFTLFHLYKNVSLNLSVFFKLINNWLWRFSFTFFLVFWVYICVCFFLVAVALLFVVVVEVVLMLNKYNDQYCVILNASIPVSKNSLYFMLPSQPHAYMSNMLLLMVFFLINVVISLLYVHLH